MWFPSRPKTRAARAAKKEVIMKIELRIDDKVVVIEAEGDVSVQVVDVVCPEPCDFVPTVSAASAIAPVFVPPVVVPENVSIQNDDLFTKLSELRRELAAAENVPTYVVFKDVTLREMAEVRPADLAAFANISGVGKSKLEKYGERFIAVINPPAASRLSPFEKGGKGGDAA